VFSIFSAPVVLNAFTTRALYADLAISSAPEVVVPRLSPASWGARGVGGVNQDLALPVGYGQGYAFGGGVGHRQDDEVARSNRKICPADRRRSPELGDPGLILFYPRWG